MKGGCSISRPKLISTLIALPFALAALLYGSGFIAQFIRNYQEWQAAGSSFGTAPALPDSAFFSCIGAVFTFPYGLYGLGVCLGILAVLIVMVMRMGYGDTGAFDKERNISYSNKGTYGTAGFMTDKEMKSVVDPVADVRKHHGIILGELNGKVLCLPEKTRFNGNLAVYGASGSKKTRSFCMNMILQCASRNPMTSLIICDPKSELYEKSAAYLEDKGYIVRKFDLVTPGSSDAWNCLAEINGQELMAQLFCDVIIKNTGNGKGDHFWDNAEMNLLKALVLYVERNYPPERKNIGEVYQLLSMSSESELNKIFEKLGIDHPAKAPYSIFKQSSENVRGGVIIGLGSRLQVFQNKEIREITSHNEIDLELPGKKPCAYFCITSDQDSTFDFLSSLFLSFVFIKLVRYADQNCPGGALPVPVHVLGEELCACGVIPDLSRKISVIRSRNISMSCVFQNLAGLQNRYPYNQWQEILGNCDITLFLGCTDSLTAEFISARTGEVSINVTSKAKQLNSWRVSNYTPQYRETSGVGKRRLFTMDEVLRLDLDKALVIIRGRNILEVNKYDYSKHPESKRLRPSKASAHIPAWRKNKEQRVKTSAVPKQQNPPPSPAPVPVSQSSEGKPKAQPRSGNGKDGAGRKKAEAPLTLDSKGRPRMPAQPQKQNPSSAQQHGGTQTPNKAHQPEKEAEQDARQNQKPTMSVQSPSSSEQESGQKKKAETEYSANPVTEPSEAAKSDPPAPDAAESNFMMPAYVDEDGQIAFFRSNKNRILNHHKED